MSLGVHGVAEAGVEFAVFGFYVVGFGVEAECEVVAGRGCLAGLGAGTGAEQGVLLVGDELRQSCHGGFRVAHSQGDSGWVFGEVVEKAGD